MRSKPKLVYGTRGGYHAAAVGFCAMGSLSKSAYGER
jgi:hypothetical protein